MTLHVPQAEEKQFCNFYILVAVRNASRLLLKEPYFIRLVFSQPPVATTSPQGWLISA